MRATSRGLLIAALVIVFLSAHAASALAAQAKPLVKVVAGYGSTDGAVAPLWLPRKPNYLRSGRRRGQANCKVGLCRFSWN